MAEYKRHTLAAFYFNGGIRQIIPIYPLYAIMFGEYGVSPFYLSVLFVIWCLASLASEIPSGALADRFSRKWLVVASSVFKSAAFLCWFLEQNFVGYAIGFILWGTGSSLKSGAWEALLFDTLKLSGEETRFTRHHGRINALQTTGGMVGELAGGLLIIYGFDTVLLVSMAMPLIAAIPFIYLVSDTPTEQREGQSYMALLKAGVIEARTNLKVRYLCLVTMLLLVSFGVYDEFISPYLYESGFSLSAVAFLGAFIMFCTAAGEFTAERFDLLSMKALLGVIAVSGCLLLLAYFLSGAWIAAAIAAYCFVFAVASVQFDGRLQASIEGSARATVTSVVGFAENTGAIAWLLAFGLIAEINIASASAALAIMTIVLSLVFMWLARLWQVDSAK